MIELEKILRERSREVQMTESMFFDPYVDIGIINAFKQDAPTKLAVKKTPIPIYRIYFIESQIVVTYMTHLLQGEYDVFLKIINASPDPKGPVTIYSLIDDKVILQEFTNIHVLAHLLFRFHHRITKKYIGEERSLF